jgi:hypothetical protein
MLWGSFYKYPIVFLIIGKNRQIVIKKNRIFEYETDEIRNFNEFQLNRTLVIMLLLYKYKY